jgi:hypothetical protein
MSEHCYETVVVPFAAWAAAALTGQVIAAPDACIERQLAFDRAR